VSEISDAEFRDYLSVKHNFIRRHFWARGYCVSTVELEEKLTQGYTRNQEQEEKRQEQMRLSGLTIASSGGGAFIKPPAFRVLHDSA